MSAIWACRICRDKDGSEDRYDTDEFMAHLRVDHGKSVISVYDGILLGSTYVHPTGPRPPSGGTAGQARLF